MRTRIAHEWKGRRRSEIDREMQHACVPRGRLRWGRMASAAQHGGREDDR